MRFIIDWTFFFEVTTPQKCEKLLAKIAQALGFSLTAVRTERYWKDEATFKVLAQSSFEAQNAKDGLYEIMTRLNRLGRAWLVGGPVEDGTWEFSGTAQKDSFVIGGIKLISFSASSQSSGAPIQMQVFARA